eukprot:m.78124 g.78124  ORF g.78124 m.78124 type:complete len:476 (+) comp19171_c0_seq1:117-1544(+)
MDGHAAYEQGLAMMLTKPANAAALFELAARANHMAALGQLGRMLYHGLGCHRDSMRAAACLQRATDAGVIDAGGVLGSRIIYLGVGGVAKDPERVAALCSAALPMWISQAEAGCPIAQTDLGWCFLHGTGCHKDVDAAVVWYKRAAAQNYVNALFNLAYCYSEGEGVTRDPREAVALYHTAAELGHSGAERNLGTCHLLGKGVEVDESQAVYWFRIAAEKGDDSAQAYLGYCYEHGIGIDQDSFEALLWYQKASDQGSNWGTRSIRFIVIQLSIAVENGESAAQAVLGYCYNMGAGVPQDQQRAAELFRKASNQNHPMAHLHLAKCYTVGCLAEADGSDAEAVRLFRLATGHGIAEAQHALAIRHALGVGVKICGQEAVRLCRLAADQTYGPSLAHLRYWSIRSHHICSVELRERVQLILLIGARLSERAGIILYNGAEPSLPHLASELWMSFCAALRPIDFPDRASLTSITPCS